jgi:hypothetical protein
VVPCPTLLVLSGFTVLAGGHGSRAVPAVLAGWSAFYAGFGIARLGVWLDLSLIVAVAALTVVALRGVRRRERPRVLSAAPAVR